MLGKQALYSLRQYACLEYITPRQTQNNCVVLIIIILILLVFYFCKMADSVTPLKIM